MKQPKLSSDPVPGTQAVRRAIALLKLFTEEHPRWKLSDLARQAKLNKATVFRLLAALEREGLMVQEIDETYSLGPEMAVLGGRALRANDLRSASHGELQTLGQTSGETASLEVLSGKDVLIVDEILGDHLLSGAQSLGTRWPAFATSTGLALLAQMPEAEAASVLKPPFPQFTPKTLTSLRAIQHEIAEARKRGFAVADETLEMGFIAIGAAVFNHENHAVAAISLGGPVLRIPRERVVQLGTMIRAAAQRISARLGFTSDHAEVSERKKTK
jgi:IclR family transcriptional regulator, acetate operon repressor